MLVELANSLVINTNAIAMIKSAYSKDKDSVHLYIKFIGEEQFTLIDIFSKDQFQIVMKSLNVIDYSNLDQYR